MKRLLLTANGFGKENLRSNFFGLIEKKPENIIAIFATAINDFNSSEMLPEYLNNLLELGILREHIYVYNFDQNIAYNRFLNTDVVFVHGNDPKYLWSRIRATQNIKKLNKYIKEGGFYVGINAGSIVISNMFDNAPEDYLTFLNCKLTIGGKHGIEIGEFYPNEHQSINLSNNCAIKIHDNKFEVI